MMVSLVRIIAGPETCHYIDALAYKDGFALLTSDRRVEFMDASAVKKGELSLRSEAVPRALASVDGMLCLVCGDRLIGLDGGEEVELEIPGGLDLVDMDSCGEKCYALTGDSEIVSFDLYANAEVFDFNAEYAPFYGEVRLCGIAVSEDAVCVAGTRLADGAPVAFISTHGKVWSRRELNYSLGKQMELLDKEPLCVAYSASRAAFVIGCRDGVLFTLPGCSHCNYPEFTRSGDIFGVAFNGNDYIAAGTEIY